MAMAFDLSHVWAAGGAEPVLLAIGTIAVGGN